MSRNFGLFRINAEAEFENSLEQLSPDKANAQSSIVFKNINLKLKNLHRLPEINKFLQTLINDAIFPNVFVFNQLMLKLFKLKQVNLALKTFKLMSKYHVQNEISYNTLISQLGHYGQSYSELIFSLFAEAKSNGLTDTITYNSMIHAMGKLNQFEQALELFLEAKLAGKINLVTFSSILYVLSKQKPVAVPHALKIFNEAKKCFQQKDSVLYANMLLCIANSPSPNPVLCQEIYDEAEHEGLLNPYIISNTLFAYSRSKFPSINAALKIVETAKKNQMLDAIAYANTLTIIAKSKTPKALLALSLLNEAIENKQIDTVVYACALDVFVNADDGQLCDAEAIFKDAKNKGMSNHVTYASYLQFLAKLTPAPITQVIDTYNEAIHLREIDSHIFSTCLYALAKVPNTSIDIAQDIFIHAIEKKAVDSICVANLLMVYQNQNKNYSREAKIVFELAKAEKLINPVIVSILLKIISPQDTFIQSLFKYCQTHEIMDEKLTAEFESLQSINTQVAKTPSSFFKADKTEMKQHTDTSARMVFNGD